MNRFKIPITLISAALALLVWSSAKPVVAQPTIITFPWDWHIEVIPEGGSTPIPIGLWGTATVAFGEPSDGLGGTFPLGPGGGLGAPIPGPVPPGNWTIPIELVQMDLVSMGPVVFPGGPPTPVLIRESPTRASQGRIENLQNNGNGTVQLDSFFDIFVEIDLPGVGMMLHNEQPMTAGMSFGRPGPFMPTGPLPETDILWAPTWIWQVYSPGTAPFWVDPALHPWDRWISVHGHVTVPEPQSLALVVLSGMALVSLWRSRKV